MEIGKEDHKIPSVPFSWFLPLLTHYSHYVHRTIKAREIIRAPPGHLSPLVGSRRCGYDHHP